MNLEDPRVSGRGSGMFRNHCAPPPQPNSHCLFWATLVRVSGTKLGTALALAAGVGVGKGAG